MYGPFHPHRVTSDLCHFRRGLLLHKLNPPQHKTNFLVPPLHLRSLRSMHLLHPSDPPCFRIIWRRGHNVLRTNGKLVCWQSVFFVYKQYMKYINLTCSSSTLQVRGQIPPSTHQICSGWFVWGGDGRRKYVLVSKCWSTSIFCWIQHQLNPATTLYCRRVLQNHLHPTIIIRYIIYPWWRKEDRLR
jgi:hypothetical protein